MAQTFDLAAMLREHADKLNVPGAALMKYGPEDYVGAMMVVRGTLYFDGSHTSPVREAVCDCFEQYEKIAAPHLTFLWREEPPSGPTRFTYAKAPQLRGMARALGPDDHLGFAYVSGKQPHDASPWQFHVSGRREWQARMGTWGLAALEFTMPPLYVEENQRSFQELFVDFARRLKAEHGHGGHALQLSLVRGEPNEPTEALMTQFVNGIDVGENAVISGRAKYGIVDHIKTVGWLTAINRKMQDKLGGLFTIRSELPPDWFALYDYGAGIAIQAGPTPEIAAFADDPRPACYVLPNMLLRALRVQTLSDLHYGTKDGEPRLVGEVANAWLSRFDVPEEDLLKYGGKLQNEPKLTKGTTLLERIPNERN
jgi:Protein of unknown function (DUF3396)